jgi:hypothetical protein
MRIEGGADMKVKFEMNYREIHRKLRNAKLTAQDVSEIGYAGSAVIKMNQKIDVPKDTHATEISVSDHIVQETDIWFVDQIGPETTYAPYIEFGVASRPNYPIQPFVRPSAHGRNKKDAIDAIKAAFGMKVIGKWQK